MITELKCSFSFTEVFGNIQKEPECHIQGSVTSDFKFPSTHIIQIPVAPGRECTLLLNGTRSENTLKTENSQYGKFEVGFPAGLSIMHFDTTVNAPSRKNLHNSGNTQKNIYTLYFDFAALKQLNLHRNMLASLQITAEYRHSFLNSLLSGSPHLVIGGKNRDEEKGISYPLKIKRGKNKISAVINPNFSLPDMISVNIGRKRLI